MQGTIVNFRRGRKTQNMKQMVITINDVDDKEKASKFVGKEVVWKSPAGKELKGKVSAAHGNKGNLRVIFETGMPGQSLSGKVEIQ
tara:strand:- start:67 stop:324 length:258 start_codon:yes stop_codon:yes gene_type:complete